MVKKKVEFENVCVLPHESKISFAPFCFSKESISSFENFLFSAKDFFDLHAVLFCFSFALVFLLLAVTVNIIYFAAFAPAFFLSLLLLIERAKFLALKKDFDENGVF